MKKATVRLSWQRSPSADVASRQVIIMKNGEMTTIDVGPEVGEYVLEVEASSSVQFQTVVLDSEGKTATSETYSFVLGDLENPLPDTFLDHEVLGVVE